MFFRSVRLTASTAAQHSYFLFKCSAFSGESARLCREECSVKTNGMPSRSAIAASSKPKCWWIMSGFQPSLLLWRDGCRRPLPVRPAQEAPAAARRREPKRNKRVCRPAYRYPPTAGSGGSTACPRRQSGHRVRHPAALWPDLEQKYLLRVFRTVKARGCNEGFSSVILLQECPQCGGRRGRRRRGSRCGSFLYAAALSKKLREALVDCFLPCAYQPERSGRDALGRSVVSRA